MENLMEIVEEMLMKRKWAKDCLRANIAQDDRIIKRGSVKIALVESNLLNQKKEPALTEAIKAIAPEWFGDETQIILNRNVQCKKHVDKNNGYSYVCFFGDFEGGALCFEDGARFTDKYVWHKINGQIPHWNEEHTGNKYSIVLYRSGAKRKKVEAIMAGIKNKGKDKEPEA
jgi:hypothetical protein